jgi:hypothetical protein
MCWARGRRSWRRRSSARGKRRGNGTDAGLSFVIVAISVVLISGGAADAADREAAQPEEPVKEEARPQVPLSRVDVSGIAVQFAGTALDSQIIGQIRRESSASGWPESALLLAVLRESLSQMNEDKKYWLGMLGETNAIAEALGGQLEDIADAACGISHAADPCANAADCTTPVTVPISSSVRETRSLVAKNLQSVGRLQLEIGAVDLSRLDADQKQLMARLSRDARRYTHVLERYDRLSRQLPDRSPAASPASRKEPLTQQEPR